MSEATRLPEEGLAVKATLAAPAAAGVSPDEMRLVEALRRGEEAAFAKLVAQHQRALVRLATIYVRSRDLAEGGGSGHLARRAGGN